MLRSLCALRIFAAVAVLLLGAVVTAAPVRAAEKAIWGPTQLPDGRSAFAVYDELGIDTLQLVLSWSDIAPTRPGSPRDPADAAYRWPAQVAGAVAQADRHGMQLALMVTSAPGWANGARSRVWAPHRVQDFANFVTAAARRFPGVRRWMIWGEPNRDDRFQPNGQDQPTAPRAYAPLLDAAYVALKRENRRNRVIGGMTWTSGTVSPRDFLRWMRLANGRRPRLDWYGHNPFPYRYPKLADGPLFGHRDISDTDTLSRELRRAYTRTVPQWLSEYTIQSTRGSDVFATFVSEAAQARYVAAGYGIADRLGSRVSGIGWLSLLDEPPEAGSANWGVMTYDLRRKPAFGALRRAPSERLAPGVRARSSRGGLRIVVKPRISGTVRLLLRRGSRLVDHARLRVKRNKRRAVRLAARRGRYRLSVRSARGSTVHKNVRVR